MINLMKNKKHLLYFQDNKNHLYHIMNWKHLIIS